MHLDKYLDRTAIGTPIQIQSDIIILNYQISGIR